MVHFNGWSGWIAWLNRDKRQRFFMLLNFLCRNQWIMREKEWQPTPKRAYFIRTFLLKYRIHFNVWMALKDGIVRLSPMRRGNPVERFRNDAKFRSIMRCMGVLSRIDSQSLTNLAEYKSENIKIKILLKLLEAEEEEREVQWKEFNSITYSRRLCRAIDRLRQLDLIEKRAAFDHLRRMQVYYALTAKGREIASALSKSLMIFQETDRNGEQQTGTPNAMGTSIRICDFGLISSGLSHI